MPRQISGTSNTAASATATGSADASPNRIMEAISALVSLLRPERDPAPQGSTIEGAASKATGIGPARLGDHYPAPDVPLSSPSALLETLRRMIVPGDARPSSMQRPDGTVTSDPLGIEAYLAGKGPMPVAMAAPIEPAPGSWLSALPRKSLADYKGAKLVTVMSDRTATDPARGLYGGPGFGTTPLARDAGVAWAVDAPQSASTILNAVNRAGGPERTIVVPSIMSESAHQSNRSVLEKIIDALRASAQSGDVTKTRVREFEKELRAVVNKKTGERMFRSVPPVASDEFKDFALDQTFTGRAAIAQTASRRAIKDPLTDVAAVLQSTADPNLAGVPTGSLGPTIMRLDGTRQMNTMVHPSYSHLLGGSVEGAMDLIPANEVLVAARDALMKHAGHGVTPYNLQKPITQEITSALLDQLRRMGAIR